MKNLSILLSLCLITVMWTSCLTVKTPPNLVGNYPTVISVETDKSYDEVWDNVIDYFAKTGIAISTIEKASGLIVSNKVSLKGAVTMEKDGVLLDSCAYIVIPYEKNIVYLDATSDFNVRVKEHNGKVSISVNLPNIIAKRTVKPVGFQMISYPQVVEAKSTGVFEQGLLNLFK